MSKKIPPVAILTIRHKDGLLVTVEVRSTAGRNNFFNWYRRPKGVRSRQPMRESHRTPGGLEEIKIYFDAKGKDTKLTVRNRKTYKHLLTCPVDQLPGGGLAKTVNTIPLGPAWRIHQ